MVTKNTTYLAGELLVAGELSRRGYPVSITTGNSNSVDIYAESANGVLKIDAITGRRKGNWPINRKNVQDDVYYVFVHLRSEKQIKNSLPPEYFIVSGAEIISGGLIKTRGIRQGIRYQSLNTKAFRENWSKLPRP